MEGESRAAAIPVPQIVGLLVFGIALWAQVGDAYVGRLLEDGLLLVVGKAIARGEGLSFLHLPGAPPASGIAPLYPVFLGILGRVWPAFPDNIVLIQILGSGLLGATAWMITAHAGVLNVSSLAAAVVVLFGFMSTPVLGLSASAFSEPLFIALAAGAVLLADRKESDSAAAVSAGLLAGLAVLSHRLGPVVVIGVTLGFLARRQVRAAAAAMLGALAVSVPWFVWSAITQSGTNALVEAALSAARAAGVTDSGMGIMGLGAALNQLLPQLPGWLWYPIGLVAVAFAAFGVAASWRSAPALPITFVGALVWASLVADAPPRWLWVFFPWFGLFICIGVLRLWEYRTRARVAVAIASGVLVLGYAPRTIADVLQRRIAAASELMNEDLTRLVYTIAQEVPEDAVIASDADAMIHLYTGRQVVPPIVRRSDASAGSLLTYYCGHGATHIALVAGPGRLDLPDAATEPVFELTDGPALYELRCPP